MQKEKPAEGGKIAQTRFLSTHMAGVSLWGNQKLQTGRSEKQSGFHSARK